MGPRLPVYNALRGAELAMANLIRALRESEPVPGRGSPRPNEPQVSARPLFAEELARLEANRVDREAYPQTYGEKRRKQ